MELKTKNALAIHDLSGFGRCSLSVIIPTLSALGVQTTAVPTAVMSTHTGGFTDFTFSDMTDTIMPAAEHYKKLGVNFDAIYSGFLGSAKQCDIIEKIMDMNKNALRFVDPVMGDDGTMYQTYTEQMCGGISELSQIADVITPNVTEACLLLGKKYMDLSSKTAEEAEFYANELLDELSLVCRGVIIITGIEAKRNDRRCIGCAVRANKQDTVLFSEKEYKNYPGTGDIFASVVLGMMLLGKSAVEAASTAVEFTHDIILDTIKAGTAERNGVLLEKSLYILADRAKKIREETKNVNC